MTEWTDVLTPSSEGHRDIIEALSKWETLGGGKTRNPDILWFPKPSTDLGDMREKLRVVYQSQLNNEKKFSEKFFIENKVADKLVEVGAITRPSTPQDKLVTEYEEESTANKPHVSSFRMQNRLFRFLGWTSRRVNFTNQYFVTDLGIQMIAFRGPFPASIGVLNEQDLAISSLVNFSVYTVNDNIAQWDTRFKQRIVVNLLRVAAEYGYTTNNELVVTAFALKNEKDPGQVDEIIRRLHRLHDGEISMAEAFREVSVDPQNESAVNNAYDSPKVLLSLCRQTGLLQAASSKDTPYGDLRDMYNQMYSEKSQLKCSRRINLITEVGKSVLGREISKLPIWFEELKS